MALFERTEKHKQLISSGLLLLSIISMQSTLAANVIANNVSQKIILPNNAIYDDNIDIAAENAKIRETTQTQIDDAVNLANSIRNPKQISYPGIRFPVTSQLTLGIVSQTEQYESTLYPALFVIGDDQKSLAWLKQHEAMLERSNAVGYLTKVASQERFNVIQQHTALLLLAMDAAPIAKQLNIKHYPFFYKNGKIIQ